MRALRALRPALDLAPYNRVLLRRRRRSAGTPTRPPCPRSTPIACRLAPSSLRSRSRCRAPSPIRRTGTSGGPASCRRRTRERRRRAPPTWPRPPRARAGATSSVRTAFSHTNGVDQAVTSSRSVLQGSSPVAASNDATHDSSSLYLLISLTFESSVSSSIVDMEASSSAATLPLDRAANLTCPPGASSRRAKLSP